MRAEVDSCLDRIALQRRTTLYTASLSLGMHFDTNRMPRRAAGRACSKTFQSTWATRRPTSPISASASSASTTTSASKAGHELFGMLTYYHDEQVQQDFQDLQSIIVEGGGVYRSGFEGINVTPSVSYTHLRLSRETFLPGIRRGLRFEREFGAGISGFASARLLTRRSVRSTRTRPPRNATAARSRA